MPTAAPTAIPTRYAGCHFRSRLEARWAVFFDAMGIRWEYEPQGYLVGCRTHKRDCTLNCGLAADGCDCGGGLRPYLPDFHLPGMDLWVEVKGSDATIDWTLLGDAVDGIGAHLPMATERSWGRHSGISPSGGAALLVLGDVPRSDQPMAHPLLVCRKGVDVQLAKWWTTHGEPFLWQGVRDLDVYDSSWGTEPYGWVPTYYEPWAGHGPQYGQPLSVHGMSSKTRGYSVPVRRAFDAARSARFEHGQNGAT